MERYLTSTELKQNLRRAKEYAQAGLVHVLDNGRSGYVFCSAEVFDRMVAEARRKAVWAAEAKEACREGEYDRRCGHVVEGGEVLAHDHGEVAAHVLLSRTAASDIAIEYDGGEVVALAHMLARVCEDPAYGLAVELQDVAPGVRKVLVPPCELLYRWDAGHDRVFVLGIVRAKEEL